jgi:hypothetical protein
MPKIEDIFSIERNRQDESSWNKIHLFKTGEFYRAYEYSAWLTAEIAFNDKVRMQTKDRAPLKATRVEIARNNDTVCFVGVPVKSLNNRGSYGNYWSSTLASAAGARRMNVYSTGVNPANTSDRFFGLSVRAVQ